MGSVQTRKLQGRQPARNKEQQTTTPCWVKGAETVPGRPVNSKKSTNSSTPQPFFCWTVPWIFCTWENAVVGGCWNSKAFLSAVLLNFLLSGDSIRRSSREHRCQATRLLLDLHLRNAITHLRSHDPSDQTLGSVGIIDTNDSMSTCELGIEQPLGHVMLIGGVAEGIWGGHNYTLSIHRLTNQGSTSQ